MNKTVCLILALSNYLFASEQNGGFLFGYVKDLKVNTAKEVQFISYDNFHISFTIKAKFNDIQCNKCNRNSLIFIDESKQNDDVISHICLDCTFKIPGYNFRESKFVLKFDENINNFRNYTYYLVSTPDKLSEIEKRKLCVLDECSLKKIYICNIQPIFKSIMEGTFFYNSEIDFGCNEILDLSLRKDETETSCMCCDDVQKNITGTQYEAGEIIDNRDPNPLDLSNVSTNKKLKVKRVNLSDSNIFNINTQINDINLSTLPIFDKINRNEENKGKKLIIDNKERLVDDVKKNDLLDLRCNNRRNNDKDNQKIGNNIFNMGPNFNSKSEFRPIFNLSLFEDVMPKINNVSSNHSIRENVMDNIDTDTHSSIKDSIKLNDDKKTANSTESHKLEIIEKNISKNNFFKEESFNYNNDKDRNTTMLNIDLSLKNIVSKIDQGQITKKELEKMIDSEVCLLLQNTVGLEYTKKHHELLVDLIKLELSKNDSSKKLLFSYMNLIINENWRNQFKNNLKPKILNTEESLEQHKSLAKMRRKNIFVGMKIQEIIVNFKNRGNYLFSLKFGNLNFIKVQNTIRNIFRKIFADSKNFLYDDFPIVNYVVKENGKLYGVVKFHVSIKLDKGADIRYGLHSFIFQVMYRIYNFKKHTNNLYSSSFLWENIAFSYNEICCYRQVDKLKGFAEYIKDGNISLCYYENKTNCEKQKKILKVIHDILEIGYSDECLSMKIDKVLNGWFEFKDGLCEHNIFIMLKKCIKSPEILNYLRHNFLKYSSDKKDIYTSFAYITKNNVCYNLHHFKFTTRRQTTEIKNFKILIMNFLDLFSASNEEHFINLKLEYKPRNNK